jgi:hypothetical protein
VIRLDAEQQPTELTFISFDEIRGAYFDGSDLLRYGKLFFDDGLPDAAEGTLYRIRRNKNNSLAQQEETFNIFQYLPGFSISL